MAPKLLKNDDGAPEMYEDGAFVVNQSAEDVSLQQADIDDQLNSIMSEVGSDKNEVTFHFQAWRIIKDAAEKAYLFKGYVSDLPIMERLRDEYDGGKFYIQIYKNKKRYKQITVSVEAPKKQREIVQNKNDTAEILRAISEQQASMHKQMVETLMQIAGKPATPQPAQMDMMMQMVVLMKGMKDIVGGNQPVTHQSDPKEYIDVLLRGMEMGRENSSSGSSMTDVLRDAVKAIPLLTQMNSPAMPRQRPPQPAPSITPPVDTKEPETENVNMNDAMIKHYVGVLVQKAQQDSDPALYADFILDNAPDNIIEQYLMREDLIDTLNKIDPRVLTHKEWFMELRNHLHEALTAPDEDNDNMVHDPLAPQQSATDTLRSGGDSTNT